MPSPRILIVRAPGTNCDQETAHAFQLAGGLPDVLHVNRLLEKPSLLDDYQVLCVPGGFSYGDDVAAGKILANQFRLHLAEPLMRFREQGKLMLGICNGFQVLIKAAVLPSSGQDAPVATLAWNDSGRFEARWVHLAVQGDRCVMLEGIESLYLPVAHAEGKFVAGDPRQLAQLGSAGQLVLRYVVPDDGGRGPAPYPWNPNGSMADVAGICDPTGRVLGLMPHPERYVQRTQHPRWTRQQLPDAGDGLAVFRNAVRYFAS
jgi:phosphoribosylformylglycinamidine synthase subunit PurQ / glutaminase